MLRHHAISKISGFYPSGGWRMLERHSWLDSAALVQYVRDVCFVFFSSGAVSEVLAKQGKGTARRAKKLSGCGSNTEGAACGGVP